MKLAYSLVVPLVVATVVGGFRLPFSSRGGDQVALVASVATEDPAEGLKGIEERTSDSEWNCTVRAWVRAPDLIPNTVQPAEARLAANGSACVDIANWEVGLRLKERAIVKMKSKSIAEFPVKPTQALRNQSMVPMVRTMEPDFNDVFFSPRYNHMRDESDKEYRKALESYGKKLEDHSLWEVHGAERAVFDLTLELPLDQSSVIDSVKGFHVHVPNTNFPPTDSERRVTQGVDEQMTGVETQLEYYFLLTLANGTVIDIPAGRTAFLPRPQPVAPAPRSVQSWPQAFTFESPRLNQTTEDEGDRMWGAFRGNVPPACDEGQLAQFHIKADIVSGSPVQGQNLTLNVTLTRTGNGTEYPAYIDIGYSNEPDFTWARSHVTTDDEYNDLIRSSRMRNGFSGLYMGARPRMLMVKSQAELEQERNERNERNRFVAMHVMDSFSSARSPLQPDMTRYDFEDNMADVQDVYQFQVEVPINYNDLPSFVSTFFSTKSLLRFTLRTMFMCQPLPHCRAISGDDIADSTLIRDQQWTEYNLPATSDVRAVSIRRDRHLVHISSIKVDIAFSTPQGESEPKHYLDPTALGPVLSLQGRTDATPFGTLGTVRSELPDELRKTRYHHNNHAMWPFGGNRGGGFRHAAKLWQREEHRLTDNELGIPPM